MCLRNTRVIDQDWVKQPIVDLSVQRSPLYSVQCTGRLTVCLPVTVHQYNKILCITLGEKSRSTINGMIRCDTHKHTHTHTLQYLIFNRSYIYVCVCVCVCACVYMCIYIYREREREGERDRENIEKSRLYSPSHYILRISYHCEVRYLDLDLDTITSTVTCSVYL